MLPGIKLGVSAVLLALLVSCGKAESEDSASRETFTEHEFRARVSQVRLQAQLLKVGKAAGDMATARVPAILYPRPLVIDDARQASTGPLPAEVRFLVEYTRANLEGTPEDIAGYWVPSLRAEKLRMVRKYFQRNRELVAQDPGLTILAIVEHEDHSRSVLQRISDKLVMGVTMIKQGGRLYLKDAPENELELSIIEASF